MLRGNHECSSLNRIYGFFDECKRRYSVKLWRVFGDCFNCMPVAAVVGDRILCMHGGLSPELESLDQIRALARPTEVPEDGLLCDLLWSDPEPRVTGCVEIKSSTRLQCARMRPFRRKAFCCASRTRREQSIRPKISRIDVDLTELENFKVWSGRPKPVVDLHTGSRPPGAGRRRGRGPPTRRWTRRRS